MEASGQDLFRIVRKVDQARRRSARKQRDRNERPSASCFLLVSIFFSNISSSLSLSLYLILLNHLLFLHFSFLYFFPFVSFARVTLLRPLINLRFRLLDLSSRTFSFTSIHFHFFHYFKSHFQARKLRLNSTAQLRSQFSLIISQTQSSKAISRALI